LADAAENASRLTNGGSNQSILARLYAFVKQLFLRVLRSNFAGQQTLWEMVPGSALQKDKEKASEK